VGPGAGTGIAYLRGTPVTEETYFEVDSSSPDVAVSVSKGSRGMNAIVGLGADPVTPKSSSVPSPPDSHHTPYPAQRKLGATKEDLRWSPTLAATDIAGDHRGPQSAA
jgi:hypothetical protein